ncbi:MAG TPA: SRPBCC family protein [Vicinamibacterales bacterium]|nr:SRPBCC family protein [Vicinamibacterales bacterium]
MTTGAVGFRVLVLIGVLTLILGAFLVHVRPWYLRWGATDAEVGRALPGDDIVPAAISQQTRAITIDAPVERVWPWLAQLGQDRGGFYSFDLLENAVGARMPTDDVLRPNRQTWVLGDRLWMYPPDRAGGTGFATLRVYVPGRVLGFATRAVGTRLSEPENGSWSFVLEPVGPDATRLLIRGRLAPGRPAAGVAFDRLVFEPIHFFMERRMMLGLRELAERRARSRGANHAQVGLSVAAFLLMIGMAVMVLRRRDCIAPAGAFIGTAMLFQVLTLGQPPLALGALLLTLTSVSFAALRREGPPPEVGGR